MQKWRDRWRAYGPVSLSAGWREICLGGLCAALGLWACEALARWALGASSVWFIAPMGASAVLLFGVPASPLAQPWSVVGGNLVSALVGVACYRWLGSGGMAAALAVGLAITAMFALRCLHPPGGAVALTAVLGGPAVHALGFSFAAAPVLLDSCLLVALAVVFNNLVRRRYPHQVPGQVRQHQTQDPVPSARLAQTDLDAVLAGYGEVLDIDREDLEELLVRAQLQAQRRRWGEVRCADIMARDVVKVGPRDSVDEAWHRLVRHQVKALPVVDEADRLVGIVSLRDFFIGQSAPVPQRLPVMSLARRVEQVMTRKVHAVRASQPLWDVVRDFSDGLAHHVPVLDDDQRVVGMITQSDVVAALCLAATAPQGHSPAASTGL